MAINTQIFTLYPSLGKMSMELPTMQQCNLKSYMEDCKLFYTVQFIK